MALERVLANLPLPASGQANATPKRITSFRKAFNEAGMVPSQSGKTKTICLAIRDRLRGVLKINRHGPLPRLLHHMQNRKLERRSIDDLETMPDRACVLHRRFAFGLG